MQSAYRRHSLVLFAAVTSALAILSGGTARGEIFVLANDGQVQGEEIKVAGTPANQIVIRTASGASLRSIKARSSKSFRRLRRNWNTSGFGPRMPTPLTTR